MSEENVGAIESISSFGTSRAVVLVSLVKFARGELRQCKFIDGGFF